MFKYRCSPLHHAGGERGGGERQRENEKKKKRGYTKKSKIEVDKEGRKR